MDWSGFGGEGKKRKDSKDVWKGKLARFGDRLDVGGEKERISKRAGRRMVVLFPEVGMLEEGPFWSRRSSCVGGGFELSQRRCQLGYTFDCKCVTFQLSCK